MGKHEGERDSDDKEKVTVMVVEEEEVTVIVVEEEEVRVIVVLEVIM